jgi:hypothetical protein
MRSAVVHPDAPPQYLPPARSVARGEQYSGRPGILDAPRSKSSGHWDRFAGDETETNATAGARHASRARPLAGRGSDRVSPRVPRPAPSRDGQFIPGGICWVGERSFAWLSRYRRLNTILERSKEHLVAFVAIAFISILSRRPDANLKRFVRTASAGVILDERRRLSSARPPASSH